MRFSIFIIVITVLLSSACGNKSQKQQTTQQPALEFSEARRMLAEGKKLVLQADSLHLSGEGVIAEQRAEEGIVKLRQLIAKAPDYRNASVALLGHAAYIKRDYSSARQWLTEAIEMDSRDVQSLMWLGLSYLATSKPDSAQSLFARSISYYDESSHRARMVKEIYKVGTTAFEFGVSHQQDGYPQKGFDYKVYGTYVASMAWELDKEDSMPEIKGQVLTYAKALMPEAEERNDEARIQFFNNVIKQLQ